MLVLLVTFLFLPAWEMKGETERERERKCLAPKLEIFSCLFHFSKHIIMFFFFFLRRRPISVDIYLTIQIRLVCSTVVFLFFSCVQNAKDPSSSMWCCKIEFLKKDEYFAKGFEKGCESSIKAVYSGSGKHSDILPFINYCTKLMLWKGDNAGRSWISHTVESPDINLQQKLNSTKYCKTLCEKLSSYVLGAQPSSSINLRQRSVSLRPPFNILFWFVNIQHSGHKGEGRALHDLDIFKIFPRLLFPLFLIVVGYLH